MSRYNIYSFCNRFSKKLQQLNMAMDDYIPTNSGQLVDMTRSARPGAFSSSVYIALRIGCVRLLREVTVPTFIEYCYGFRASPADRQVISDFLITFVRCCNVFRELRVPPDVILEVEFRSVRVPVIGYILVKCSVRNTASYFIYPYSLPPSACESSEIRGFFSNPLKRLFYFFFIFLDLIKCPLIHLFITKSSKTNRCSWSHGQSLA